MEELLRSIYSTFAYGKIDYGLHEPLPPPSSEETPTSQHIQGILEQQQQSAEVQSMDLRLLHLTLGAENNIVTVTDSSSGGECDLHYLIYVLFLANVDQEQSTLQETTARTFTTGVIS
ncbi:hypothetical protein PENCOP_c001G07003 [Penicillium coprophilum]|uniref:Uncharacterized protein n=1 Tax=Penicillium coprophilum TaxID=36646 RepID=A0A1V6V960_9EURO|nr:hypothetical protein PENCOP_c001G07003 [Penicillium coprophilum]